MTLYSLAKKNIKRSPFRSGAVALGVAIVAATLFCVTAIIGLAGLSLQRRVSTLNAELIVVPQEEAETMTKFLAGHFEKFKFDMQHNILDDVRGMSFVKNATPLLFLIPQDTSSSIPGNTVVVGYDPKTDFTIKPWLKQNRTPSDKEVIIGGKVSYERNQKIKILGTELVVAGKLETTGIYFLDNSIFIPITALRQLAGKPDRISAIMVQPELNDFGRVRTLGLTIQEKIKGVKSLMTEETISTARRQIATLMKGVLLTAALIWTIALIMIGVIFSMIINERQREIGFLRAMGATKMHVFRLAMIEASLLSVFGGAAGVIAGAITAYAFKSVANTLFAVQYALPEPAHFVLITVLSLLLSIISGAVATFFPALRSSLMQPQEAISKGN